MESLKSSSRADTRLHQFPSMGRPTALLRGTVAHRDQGGASTWAPNGEAARAHCPGQQVGVDLSGHCLQEVGPGLPITPPLQSDRLWEDGKDSRAQPCRIRIKGITFVMLLYRYRNRRQAKVAVLPPSLSLLMVPGFSESLRTVSQNEWP